MMDRKTAASQIEGLKDGVNGEITAYVMTGRSPAIHDRFLIIDGEELFHSEWLGGKR